MTSAAFSIRFIFGPLAHLMKSSKIIHHRGNDGNAYHTVEAEIEALRVATGLSGVQDLNGAGAVNLTTLTTKWGTTGADAGTLADGSQNQIKIIIMDADGGDGTLTPTNFGNGTTITFNDVGDAVMLIFIGSDWWVLSNNGCTVA